jgi:alpha-ketoglutarate-dependent taurine dioxygenase
MHQTRTWQPTEITPEAAGVPPSPAGLSRHLADADRLAADLLAAKALVFRGFGIREEDLSAVLDLVLPHRLAYVHGNSPRSKVGRNVYTSTEYPPEFTISMHNELSYLGRWPARLAFFCARSPSTGGATPVVDGHRWLTALDPQVRDAFSGGVRYIQNLHGGRGLGKSWQETFETQDRAEVERHLGDADTQWWWTADGGLRITQVRPATVRHPGSGVEVWFNQADQWHPAGLGDDLAAELAQILPEEELPQSVRFADGSPIPAEYVVQVRERGLEAAQDVDWAAGDLMVIDNVAVGHGRRSFTGSRRVLVAMSD